MKQRPILAITIAATFLGSIANANDWLHDNVEFYPEWVAKFAGANDFCRPLAGKADPVFGVKNPELPEWMQRFSDQYSDQSYRDSMSTAELRLLDHSYKIGMNDAKTFTCYHWVPQLETMYLRTIVDVNG